MANTNVKVHTGVPHPTIVSKVIAPAYYMGSKGSDADIPFESGLTGLG